MYPFLPLETMMFGLAMMLPFWFVSINFIRASISTLVLPLVNEPFALTLKMELKVEAAAKLMSTGTFPLIAADQSMPNCLTKDLSANIATALMRTYLSFAVASRGFGGCGGRSVIFCPLFSMAMYPALSVRCSLFFRVIISKASSQPRLLMGMPMFPL